jgi:hypothetical protein
MDQTPEGKIKRNKRSNDFRSRLKAKDEPEMRRRERESALRTKYGFGQSVFDAMFAAQQGKCAICQQPPTRGRGKRFHVDHDHQTGKIRGLLCSVCNVSLGGFGDDPNILRRAIGYLEA